MVDDIGAQPAIRAYVHARLLIHPKHTGDARTGCAG